MDGSNYEKTLLTVDELSDSTGASPATIWRLKKAGRIPFYQPGGKGHKVFFPSDALEQAGNYASPDGHAGRTSAQLGGPMPAWMKDN